MKAADQLSELSMDNDVEQKAGVEVDPALDWHDRGCIKRYGAILDSGAMCECEKRRADQPGEGQE